MGDAYASVTKATAGVSAVDENVGYCFARRAGTHRWPEISAPLEEGQRSGEAAVALLLCLIAAVCACR